MVEGVLTVNLEPAYVGFSQSSSPLDSATERIDAFQYCSLDDIHDLLIELGAVVPGQS